MISNMMTFEILFGAERVVTVVVTPLKEIDVDVIV